MAESNHKRKQFVKMSNTHIFSETGNRIMHICLVDADSVPILAIVGTEVRPRQMSYVVTEEFVKHVGLDKAHYTGKRWTSKNEVFGWLKNFVSNPPSSDLGGHCMQSAPETLLNAEMIRKGNVEGEEAQSIKCSLPTGDIEWFGSFMTDNKGSRHYGAFRRNGVTVSARSFIYVFTTHYSHLVAYIESLYETRHFKKKMRVIWLHKKEEINSENFVPKPHPKEVFMSVNHQAIGLESFNGVATVLTWDHFERCKSVLPGQVMEAYVCRRLFHAEGHLEAFDIGMLEGYWDQNILSMAGIRQVNEASVKKKGPRKPRKRSGRSPSITEGFLTEDKMIQLGHYKADGGTGSSSKTCSMSESDFGPNTEVEVLSEDSGLRGCWFRCYVLEKNSDKVKLQFQEVKVVDTVENLEEWHSLGTVAASDELRAPGRWTIRPRLPQMDVSPEDESGTAVDVQFENCWCEGVLIGHCSKGETQVYLPEKKQIKTFHMSRLRISRDWVDGEWIDLARAKLHGKVSPLHCERLLTSQALKISEEEPKPAFSDFESDITAAHQSSDSDVPVTEREVADVKEEMLLNFSNCSGKMSDSGCVRHADLRHSRVPVRSSRNFLGVNGSVQHNLEPKQLDVDRFEKRLPPEVEMTGAMWKLSRKRPHEIEVSMSAMSAMSNLVLNGLQGNEDQSIGWLTENEKKDISEGELKRSRYGHEHVKPLSRSSAGGSLFNTVSTPNLVMSR